MGALAGLVLTLARMVMSFDRWGVLHLPRRMMALQRTSKINKTITLALDSAMRLCNER